MLSYFKSVCNSAKDSRQRICLRAELLLVFRWSETLDVSVCSSVRRTHYFSSPSGKQMELFPHSRGVTRIFPTFIR